MAKFSENRHISDLIDMSCKVFGNMQYIMAICERKSEK